MKEIFTSIFIVIVIAELIYVVFNLVYFKWINPSFWQNFQSATLMNLQTAHQPAEQIDQQMKGFKEMERQTSSGNLIKGYGFSVVIDCVFGLIFAIFLRKAKPVYNKISEDPK